MPVDLTHPDHFVHRHIGPDEKDIKEMVKVLGFASLDAFIDKVVPKAIRAQRALELSPAKSEHDLLDELQEIAAQNKLFRSLIGLGYSDTVTPPVIQRNIFENPGWYTQYTPYQAEIAQGRLEALLNFQTLVTDLTALEISSASLLDEGTAAAEAMTLFHRLKPKDQGNVFYVSETCHPQTIGVVETRAMPLGIQVLVGDHRALTFSKDVFGALVQYPATDGVIYDYAEFCQKAHAGGALVVVAADLLSLTLLKAPGEFGADAAVGNSQRFGVPLGYGGPHAAYLATKDEFKRQLPGRIIGMSIDAKGKPALRMALQTREQHIRREKATSNICTAQVLLAIIASMYAVYHGPNGLKRIALRVHRLTGMLANSLKELGYQLAHDHFFDTIRVKVAVSSRPAVLAAAGANGFNFRPFDDGSVGIALDERSNAEEVMKLIKVFALAQPAPKTLEALAEAVPAGYHGPLGRASNYLTHPVFNTHHSETEMLRYIKSLEEKDLSLTFSMIALGSCTMKLNATAEMLAITWPEFGKIHPFAPVQQAAGYHRIFQQLEKWLQEITGFAAISFQPNSGAQGEYAGLMVVRAYHMYRNESRRNICLIPTSAHGTNPASAVMAGMNVVLVNCDENGNVDVSDLRAKADKHKYELAALMITYPSTHGVYEETIREICEIVHQHGGLVYMDGANMNAQVGLCRPAELGADVCHLNMHKTFCIPHGGGGPGMGPIGVAPHLAPFLPSHPIIPTGGSLGTGPISAAPWGSANILIISWAYIAMMGGDGLTKATKLAILNANYMAEKLKKCYPIVYRGIGGYNAHEFILDFREFKKTAGVEVEDVAKRLMDYGFHAPTVSFPVAGTLMIEPTESESKAELDRFCDALIAIREEIREIEDGKADKDNNVLKNAPHTAETVISDSWSYPYSRERAAYPVPSVRQRKFWPSVSRINNAHGDRNLVCACPPMEAYA